MKPSLRGSLKLGARTAVALVALLPEEHCPRGGK